MNWNRNTDAATMAQPQRSAKGAGGGKAAPKKKGSAAGKKVEDDREETLQAVVCNLFLCQLRSGTTEADLV